MKRSRHGVLLLAAAVLGSMLVGQTYPAGAAEVRPTPVSGTWTVDGHGNGHGHGLSQYGARGAAIAGLDYAQILSFYYPGTVLGAATAVTIRVQISGAGAYPRVRAKTGLTITGVSGALPTSGVDLWRVVPAGTGLQLQRHLGTGWSGYRDLGTTAAFRATDGWLTLQRNSAQTNYRGQMSAVRSGSGVIAVNTVSLDDYVRGVVPSEMPASWQAAAVRAQAVAARTYGRYYVAHPRGANFDICDTTACQVYGGLSAEQAASNNAVAGTANRVLYYGGAVIFAEFSASNGAITSSGNQPYFVTKPDPYDNAASGDPYLNWTATVTAADVASYFGLRTVTQIEITAREGGGQWGGLVATGIVNGTNSDGSAAAIGVSGAALASAMGLQYRYFFIRA